MSFDSAFAYTALHPHFQRRVHLHEPLAHHSSFGVGGPADIWLPVETRQELSNLIDMCARQQWPLLIVGDGSNILYADAGVRGIVASIAFHSHHLEEQSDETALLIADAGVHWGPLLQELAPLGWGGLEFAVGIPGTLGAGVISNVGAHHQELGQVLAWIEVLDARACNHLEEKEQVFPVLALRRYPSDALDLGYRHSRFREQRLTHIDADGHMIFPSRALIEPPELVVELALHLHREDPAVLQTMLERLARERKQDEPEQKHMGAIFKDPPGTTAHTLLEQTGLAGKHYGQAQIAERNANYIINLGEATAAEIVTLIIEAHQQVLTQKGIHLALNVELLGEWQNWNQDKGR